MVSQTVCLIGVNAVIVQEKLGNVLCTHKLSTEGETHKCSSIKSTRASSAADKSLDLLDYQADELILNQDMLNCDSQDRFRCQQLCVHACEFV